MKRKLRSRRSGDEDEMKMKWNDDEMKWWWNKVMHSLEYPLMITIHLLSSLLMSSKRNWNWTVIMFECHTNTFTSWISHYANEDQM